MSSIYVSQKLAPPQRQVWAKVLPAWKSLLRLHEERSFEENKSYDFAYWHGEEALTGMLAAAACKIGGWGLVEFNAANKRTKHEKCHGDIWFGYQGTSVTAECKICWRPMESPTEKLKESEKQFKRFDESTLLNTSLASICYVVPCRTTKGKRTGISDLKTIFQKHRKRSSTVAAVLYISRQKAGAVWHGDEYPGVVLLARAVKHRD